MKDEPRSRRATTWQTATRWTRPTSRTPLPPRTSLTRLSPVADETCRPTTTEENGDDSARARAGHRGSGVPLRGHGQQRTSESGSDRGRSKKDKATPKQKRDSVEHKRTGPVTFVKQSVGELRKVVYPTGPQLANYFVVVLIFVLFIIAYVSLLDLGIGAAIFRIFA